MVAVSQPYIINATIIAGLVVNGNVWVTLNVGHGVSSKVDTCYPLIRQAGVMTNIIKWFVLLIFLCSACSAQAEQTQAISEVHPELKNIPLYPNSNDVMDGNPNWGDYQPEGHTVYSYVAKTINTNTVKKYYEKNMADEWISLGTGVGSANNKEWTNMWYYKEDVFVDISISQWTTTSCLVVFDFYSDPNYKQ